MSVELYIDYFSPPCRAVLAFCYQTGIPIVIKEIRLASGQHLSEDFLKICPWGTVPAIVHKGNSFYESHAIITYLAEEFCKTEQWYPKDLVARTRINTYLNWHHLNVRGPFGIYLFNKIFGPKVFKVPFSQDINDRFEGEQRVSIGFLEEVLGTGFVASSGEPSVADICLYCELSQSSAFGIDLSGYKNVQKWMRKMETLNGIQEAHKIFNKMIPKFKL